MNRLRFTFCLLLIGVTAFVSSVNSAMAVTTTHGTLVANDRDDIYDNELADLLNTYIFNNPYGSAILAFTECYGGDKMDDFAGKANTAILSGSQPGKTTDYGGYHRGLAKNLKPGTTTDAAHTAADAVKGAGDTPNKAGPSQNIGIQGSITSTHVLVWAGKPNAQDQADINDIKANFPAGANQSVTVLSGAGGAGTDGAATRANLKQALKDIKDKMNANEQFILFVTDHGDIDHGTTATVSGLNPVTPATVNIPITIVTDMQNDTSNDPTLTLIYNPLTSSLTQSQFENLLGQTSISLQSENGFDPIFPGGGSGAISSFFDVFYVDSDETPGPESIHYLSKPGVLDESKIGTNDTILFEPLFAPSSFFDVFVSIDSGSITRLPEPASMSLLVVGGMMVLGRRRA